MLLKSLSLILVILLPFYVSAETIAENPEVQDYCKRISDKLASLSHKRCLSHRFEIADGRSVKGAPILVKMFDSDNDNTTHKRILLIGGIHGDEYSSVSVVFKWITLLNQYYTGSYHWQIIPLLNPDGLLRKSSKRVNANGVDLDRNFPSGTDHGEANQYWEENTHWDPDYFPGKMPLSEPETHWLAEEIERYQPDAIVAVHAPNSTQVYKLPKDNQPELGGQYQNIIATYPGSFNQYVGSEINIPIITIELPYADVMPAKSEINEIWRNLVKWLNESL